MDELRGGGSGRRAASPTCTCTPSTRCSTARPGSTRSWPRPRPTGSRRSASPTTATCTASSTSTRRASAAGHQAGHRHRGLHGLRATAPSAPTRGASVDDTGGEAEGGQKAYYHLTAAGRERRPATATSSSSRAGRSSRATTTSPRSTGSCSPTTARASSPPPAASAATCCSACCGDDSTRRSQKAGRLQDIFGRDNLFVELQDHGLPEQHRTNPQLIEIARSIGAPLLATNDSHYTHRDDAEAHDALLCVQTGSLIERPRPLQVRRRRATT